MFVVFLLNTALDKSRFTKLFCYLSIIFYWQGRKKKQTLSTHTPHHIPEMQKAHHQFHSDYKQLSSVPLKNMCASQVPFVTEWQVRKLPAEATRTRNNAIKSVSRKITKACASSLTTFLRRWRENRNEITQNSSATASHLLASQDFKFACCFIISPCRALTWLAQMWCLHASRLDHFDHLIWEQSYDSCGTCIP